MITFKLGATYLESATKCVHQNGKEEESASLVEAVRVGLQIIEDTTNDKSHDCIAKKLRKCERRITSKTLEATPKAEFDLLHV
jgi:hypothetical protein